MKKWITILLVLVLVLSMTACGTKEKPTTIETQATTVPTPTKAEEIIPTTTPADGDDWESQVEADVEATLAALTAEYESIITGVDSYAAYMEKQAEIAAFYEKVIATSESLCIKMCAYAADYAESVLASGKDTDDMYDDLEIVYDLIYDDMGDEIYDGIYDGILDDIYDDFYDGALDDRPDDVEYSAWSDARSKEYEQWSDNRSETYEHWSDFRSDVYGFWSDMRSELWGDDSEGAQDELEDFRKDVAKMSGKAAEVPAETTAPTTTADGIRPEFKEAMDSYEKFFDEYVTFMKAYMDSDDALSMMGEYTTMMQQYVKTMGEFESIDESELSNEEALYYAEVVLRINQKLLEVI